MNCKSKSKCNSNIETLLEDAILNGSYADIQHIVQQGALGQVAAKVRLVNA